MSISSWRTSRLEIQSERNENSWTGRKTGRKNQKFREDGTWSENQLPLLKEARLLLEACSAETRLTKQSVPSIVYTLTINSPKSYEQVESCSPLSSQPSSMEVPSQDRLCIVCHEINFDHIFEEGVILDHQIDLRLFLDILLVFQLVCLR